MNESFEDDFKGEDGVPAQKKHNDLEGQALEFMGYRVGDRVAVTGMEGDYIIDSFDQASSEAELKHPYAESDDDRVRVSMDRLVKK